MAGTTDYGHQPLNEIRNDIGRWLALTTAAQTRINHLWNPLRGSKNDSEVSHNLSATIEKSLVFFRSATEDLQGALDGIEGGLQEYHARLLRRIGEAAWDLEEQWGTSWNEHLRTPRFGYPSYPAIEEIYKEGRQACIDLLDCGNAAIRLRDFAGRPGFRESRKELLASLEVKPGIFGFSLDLKRLVAATLEVIRLRRQI